MSRRSRSDGSWWREEVPGARNKAGVWWWTSVGFAGLDVSPTFSNNYDFCVGRTTSLTSVGPRTPTMIWDEHVTQISSLVFELWAFVEWLKKKRMSLPDSEVFLRMLTCACLQSSC